MFKWLKSNKFKWLKSKSIHDLPFEFGPISERDRMQLKAYLKCKNQGCLLLDQTLSKEILQSNSTSLDAKDIAKSVFSIIQHFFKDPSAIKLLEVAPIIGVMSDSLAVNGLAGKLHFSESKHYVNVTVGTILRGTIALYRLSGAQTLSQNGISAVLEATSCFHPNDKLYIPRSPATRKYAMKCAYYGTLAVFCHELAHVLRGHTSYMGNMHGIDSIEESSSTTPSSCSDVLRLIEIDADVFAGKFLADILFKKFLTNKDLLNDKIGTEKFLQVAAGVLALYLGFGKGNSVYFSGSVRAYLVLSSLLQRCSKDPDSATWLREQIKSIQDDMIFAKLFPENHIDICEKEKHELVNIALPNREEMQNEWLKHRTWVTQP